MSTSASGGSATRPRDAAGYYGLPIVKAHPWKDFIGWYFFTGGLAGASSVLAAAAELTGSHGLAKHARRASLIGLLPSPALLIADLGRPKRFVYMLRVLKPTSPMSIGSWLLAAYGGLAGGSAALGELHLMPRSQRALGLAAGVTGSAVATYTAVLVADTATPAWHEARRELPFLFAASAAASAGAVTTALAALSGDSQPAAARVGALGAVGEVAMSTLMKRRLGPLDTYDSDASAHRLDRISRALAMGGAAALVAGRRHRSLHVLGGLAVAAGSACERLAVLRAGKASADDPRSVIAQGRTATALTPQTERFIEPVAGYSGGGTRKACDGRSTDRSRR